MSLNCENEEVDYDSSSVAEEGEEEEVKPVGLKAEKSEPMAWASDFKSPFPYKIVSGSPGGAEERAYEANRTTSTAYAAPQSLGDVISGSQRGTLLQSQQSQPNRDYGSSSVY